MGLVKRHMVGKSIVYRFSTSAVGEVAFQQMLNESCFCNGLFLNGSSIKPILCINVKRSDFVAQPVP